MDAYNTFQRHRQDSIFTVKISRTFKTLNYTTDSQSVSSVKYSGRRKCTLFRGKKKLPSRKTERTSIHLSNGLNGEQNNHRVRCASTVVCRESTEKTHWTFIPSNLHRAIYYPVVRHLSSLNIWLLIHDPRFDQVEGEREQCRRESLMARSRSKEMREKRWNTNNQMV